MSDTRGWGADEQDAPHPEGRRALIALALGLALGLLAGVFARKDRRR